MRKVILFYINGHPVHLWRAHPHADYSTDIAFVLSKICGGIPRQWAERIVSAWDA